MLASLTMCTLGGSGAQILVRDALDYPKRIIKQNATPNLSHSLVEEDTLASMCFVNPTQSIPGLRG